LDTKLTININFLSLRKREKIIFELS